MYLGGKVTEDERKWIYKRLRNVEGDMERVDTGISNRNVDRECPESMCIAYMPARS